MKTKEAKQTEGTTGDLRAAISQKSTTELLRIKNYDESDANIAYEATWCLFERWRKGIDLDQLINLMKSKNSSDRLFAAYALSELGEPVEGLKIHAIKFADDSLAACRRAFVSYIWNSRDYDKPIATALAECLLDYDLSVRLEVIRWAARAPDERFAMFSRLVESGAGRREFKSRNPLSNEFFNISQQKRAHRGLEIIRRIRSGDDIQKIREVTPEEDSIIFDHILFINTIRERERKWKEMKSDK
jgi:hypothetical protein